MNETCVTLNSEGLGELANIDLTSTLSKRGRSEIYRNVVIIKASTFSMRFDCPASFSLFSKGPTQLQALAGY